MKRWLIVGGVIVASVVMPLAAVAATPAPTPSGAAATTPGQGLEISPPVLNLTANPGQTVTADIRVRNVSSGTLITSGKADDFGASNDESGQPKLLLNETGATRYSLKYWVPNVPSLNLAPQELKTAIVNINVPANAEPGGHFGVIRFTATPPNLQGTGVSLSASVGTLVLLRVNGAVTDSLKVSSLTASQKGHTHSFFEHGPVDFTLRLQNEGTVHEKPVGNIVVKDLLGRKTGTVVVNEKAGNVLPDSIRRFDESLGAKRLFGRYTATFTGTYLDDNHRLTAKMSFWVIPWKLVLLVLLGIVIFAWVLKAIIKRYNAHIIAQARRR